MAFGSHCGEKKLEFSHQNSALPMIFFKILQKARISRIFQTRAFRKTERAEPNRAEPRLGSNTTSSAYLIKRNWCLGKIFIVKFKDDMPISRSQKLRLQGVISPSSLPGRQNSFCQKVVWGHHYLRSQRRGWSWKTQLFSQPKQQQH